MKEDRVTAEDERADAASVETVASLAAHMDLDRSIHQSKMAVDLFFNNQFQDAWHLLQPWVGTSMYHTVGNSVFLFLEAVLTFEPEKIQKASESLRGCMSLCNFYRKKSSVSGSFSSMVKRTVNYDLYTSEEVHAELCFAESLLLKAMLTFIEDDKLVSFIKGGLRIRTCYSTYKNCHTILNVRHWTIESHKLHFESGVRMGIGAFNLLISLLPARVAKLLEFVGFSGSKEVGLDELIKCYHLPEGLRHVLSVLLLLSYNLYVLYIFSHCDGDLELCEEILQKELKVYPNGAWFLYLKARLEFVKGNLLESSKWYIRSWKSQSVWPHFHHLCFWELMWINVIIQEWDEALKYNEMLLNGSKWSLTIYSYQRACFLMMKKDKLTTEDKKLLDKAISNVPLYKQKIAGKSLPVEKFCIKKSERYNAQDKQLVLPALELILAWNLFRIVGKKSHYCSIIYKTIEQTEKSLDAGEFPTTFEFDNRALVSLLKGTCLHYMKKPLLAEEALNNVLVTEKEVKDDLYLIPFALVELALICYEQGNAAKAIQLLEDAKNKYTGYSLESRLHFQIHSALQEFHQDNSSQRSAVGTS